MRIADILLQQCDIPFLNVGDGYSIMVSRHGAVCSRANIRKVNVMKRTPTKLLCILIAAVMILVALPVAASADDAGSAVTSAEITMTPGASIRVDGEIGIRFEATVSKLWAETYGADQMKVGMIIAPTEKITGEFTDTAMQEGDYIKQESSGWYSRNEDGSLTYRVALVGIPETAAAVTTKFSARAYAEITSGSETLVYWSAFDKGANKRSIHDVAQLAKLNSADYANNETIQRLVSLAPATDTMFSYAQENPSQYIANIGFDSFSFPKSIANVDDLRTQIQVKSNTTLTVGQKVEFDFAFLFDSSEAAGKSGDYNFWLVDSTKSLEEGIFSTLHSCYAGTTNCANRVYSGAKLTGGKTTIFENGSNLHWDHRYYHITIEVLPGTAATGNRAQVITTYTEIGRSDPKSASVISYPTKDAPETLTLLFASAKTPYEISNLKVSDLEEGRTATLFTKIGSMDETYVTINETSFRYTEAYRSAADQRANSIMRVNLPVTVGQKIEFDYTWLGSHIGEETWNEVYFWLENANRTVKFWEDYAYTSAWFYYYTGNGANGKDIQQAAFKNKIVNGDGKGKFNDGEKGDGRNMPWDIEKYKISIAITEGIDGNALFTYTITVNDGSAHQGKFCTIDYQSATKVSDLENATLSFASLWVAYEISNVTVTDIQ